MTAVAASRPSRGMLESIGLKRETVTKILAALVIIVALIWTVWPIAYLFGNSFKTRIDMFSFDLIFFPELGRATTEHYEKAFLGACAVEILVLGDWRAAAGEVGFWPECGHLARPTLGWKSQTGRPEGKRFAFHTCQSALNIDPLSACNVDPFGDARRRSYR